MENPFENFTAYENVKLFISTPCYDSMVSLQYTISLLNLTRMLPHYNIDFVIDFIGNESLIPRARNNSLAKFMKSDSTHMLFIDSDIEFPCDAVLTLLKADKDVACCSYPKKGFNWKKLIHSVQTDRESNEAISSRGLDFAYNVITDKENNIIRQGDFIRVKHASTGFMMIKKEIVTKLTEKHSELMFKTDSLSKIDNTICGLFCCMIKDNQYLSEDYSFCDRVNDIGGEIWINTSHNLNHIGKFRFESDIKNRTFLGRSDKERMFY